MKKNVIIVDDHPIVRQGFVLLINQEHDLFVSGQAEDACSALSLISEKKPDIVLVDITLKNSNGIELIKDIKARFPQIKTLVISLHDENIYAERAIKAGASGYIMKAEATEKVMDAIREVLSGSIYLSSAIRTRMLKQYAGNKESGKGKNPVDLLSDREFEVFDLIGKGNKTGEIAERLNLSVKTIETYKENIKKKLELKNSSELAQYSIKWIISSEEQV
jgi:DNA-binding NarL/FixJ family response regulator